jgi:hypothetical protein
MGSMSGLYDIKAPSDISGTSIHSTGYSGRFLSLNRGKAIRESNILTHQTLNRRYRLRLVPEAPRAPHPGVSE